MSTQNRLNIMLATNFVLFLYAVVMSSVVGLIAINPSEPAPHVIQENLKAELDAKYADLLLQANLALVSKEMELQSMQNALLVGYVESKDIEVTDRDQAYWLAEPNLMLGVRALTGGQLKVFFAGHEELISVGQRIDFKFEDCDCFLLLKSSSIGRAQFRYACTPENPAAAEAAAPSFVEARLN